MEKVTVVIPVYNVEEYIRECLLSIQNQSLIDIQIIVVNDGSTDNSITIIEDIIENDNRISLITQKNKGLSGARNTGLEYATGEYISFIDSDDIVSEYFLEDLYLKAKKWNLDVVRSSFRDLTGEIPQGWRPDTKNNNRVMTGTEALGSLLDSRTSFVVWSSLYRRDFLAQNQLNFEEGILLEDGDFICRTILVAKKVMFLENINYAYRVRPNSILTTKNFQKMSNSEAIIAIKFLNLIENSDDIDQRHLYKRSLFGFFQDWTRIVYINNLIFDINLMNKVFFKTLNIHEVHLPEKLKIVTKVFLINLKYFYLRHR